MGIIYPVSYTHLDVYKRQVQFGISGVFDNDGTAVTISTNVVTINLNKGIIVNDSIGADIYDKLMNEMGYDAGIIGNHEFDLGLDNMARLFKMADFPRDLKE